MNHTAKYRGACLLVLVVDLVILLLVMHHRLVIVNIGQLVFYVSALSQACTFETPVFSSNILFTWIQVKTEGAIMF